MNQGTEDMVRQGGSIRDGGPKALGKSVAEACSTWLER